MSTTSSTRARTLQAISSVNRHDLDTEIRTRLAAVEIRVQALETGGVDLEPRRADQ